MSFFRLKKKKKKQNNLYFSLTALIKTENLLNSQKNKAIQTVKAIN